MLADAPRLSPNDAERVAREHFGFDGRATELTSERDQNFLIDGRRRPRSCSRSRTPPRIGRCSRRSSAATRAPRGTARHDAARRCRTINGRRSSKSTAPDGQTPFRLGDHLARRRTARRPSSRRSPELVEDLGRQIGALDARARRLRPSRRFIAISTGIWPTRAPIVDASRSLIVDAELGAAIDRARRRDSIDAPRRCSTDLAARCVHGDLNDYNVLVGGGDDVETRGQRITGIVDFGDMVHSYRVGDLAIAIAYAMLDAHDPLASRRDRRADTASAARSTTTSWRRCSGSSRSGCA